MNFLKKLGQVVLKIVGIESVFLPLVQAFVPASVAPIVKTVATDVSDVANVVVTAEQMAVAMFGPDQKVPSQKLAAARPYVAAILQNSAFLTGKKIHDEAAFEAGVDQIVSGFVGVLNSVGQ